MINEVLSHTDAPLEDAIELHNFGEAPVDISGWRLGDAFDSRPRSSSFPPGTILAAGGYTVIYEGGFNRGGAGFSLNSAHGDTVYLSAVGAGGKPSGFRAVQTIPPMANGVSVGRVTTRFGAQFRAVGQSALSAIDVSRVGCRVPRGRGSAQRQATSRPGRHQRNHVRGPAGRRRPWLERSSSTSSCTTSANKPCRCSIRLSRKTRGGFEAA